jgi:DNA adenine methylase
MAFDRTSGSKRKLVPVLLDAAPKRFDRYVEPFAGSACLFFALGPRRSVLADINRDLINTYRALKTNVEIVIRHLESFRCNKTEYYFQRSRDVSSMSEERQAARFIYLNRFCFNGLYRTNRQGRFNVPYGGYKSGNLPSADLLRSCAISLRHTVMSARPFTETLERVRTGDFVYLDPPYSVASRRVFNEYSHFSFGSRELQILRAHLLRLNGMGVPFLVSYAVSREATTLAEGFHARAIVVQRQIAGFAAKRRTSRELLITNF